VAFFSYLSFSAAQLPDCVATHFNGSGQPNGWMNHFAYLIFTTAFGFVFPLLLVGLSFIGRFISTKFYNIPHRDYWLAPERQAETFSYIFCHSLWFSCIALYFIIGLHFSIVQANSVTPAHLSTPLILGLLGFFVAGIVVWIINMFRYFRSHKA
jgi:uncharacterized membrane protein